MSRVDQTSIDADAMTAVAGPGKGGSALAAELDAVGLFFPPGTAGRVHRRLSAAGRLRLEQPGGRAGLRKRDRAGRGDRRRRQDLHRRRASPRPVLGRPRRRTGVLRRRHRVSPQALPETGGAGQQLLRLSHRTRRRDIHLGPRHFRGSGPSRRVADRRHPQRPQRGHRPAGDRDGLPAFADTEAEAKKRSDCSTDARSSTRR